MKNVDQQKISASLLFGEVCSGSNAARQAAKSAGETRQSVSDLTRKVDDLRELITRSGTESHRSTSVFATVFLILLWILGAVIAIGSYAPQIFQILPSLTAEIWAWARIAYCVYAATIALFANVRTPVRVISVLIAAALPAVGFIPAII